MMPPGISNLEYYDLLKHKFIIHQIENVLYRATQKRGIYEKNNNNHRISIIRLRRSHESRGQCSTDELGRSNVGAEPAKSVNLSAASLSTHADKLRTVRQWLHKL
jgi:hypothetical protein